MATVTTSPSPLISDRRLTPPPETSHNTQEQQALTNNPTPPSNLLDSISDLRNLSTALSTFQRRYDELQQHLDFIRTTINSKLPNPLSIAPFTQTHSPIDAPSKFHTLRFSDTAQKSAITPSTKQDIIRSSTVSEPKPTINYSEQRPDAKLLDSEQKPNNHITPSNSTINSKLPNDQIAKSGSLSNDAVPDSMQKTNDANAKPGLSELEQLCSTMSGRALRRYFMSNLADLNRLRVEAPKALKLAPNPAKLVLDCVGKFFLQGIKAYCKDSSMIPAREASIFILECFLLMGIDGVVIEDSLVKEAETAAIQWRKRLMTEGGLEKACEADARGLLLLVGCFGIPGVFKIDNITDLICSSNAKGISAALQRSSVLLARIPEIIEGMINNKLEIEAIDIAYAFEVQDRFSPQTILSSFLSKSKELWNKKRKAAEGSSAAVNEANKKRLAQLKSINKCLDDHKIDLSKSFPEWEIKENILSLEKEIADLDKKVQQTVVPKRKADKVESSQRLKAHGEKRSRLSAHVPQQLKAVGHNSYSASPSVLHGSGVGLHEYSAARMEGSRGGLVVAEVAGGTSGGGFLHARPYAGAHGGMLAEMGEHGLSYNNQPYRWRGDAVLNERLIDHTFSGQPSSIGYDGPYRSTPSVEGFVGFPDHPSVAVLSRGPVSDLYQFADAVVETESSYRSIDSRPVLRSQHNLSNLY